MAPESRRDRRPVVLSAEQALSMPYATLRFVHLGWRVIRIEPTPVRGRKSVGDPNRSIGRPVAGQDRHSYFIAPNVGKEAISLDLKRPEAQRVLRRLVEALDVDVFCTNTMLSRHSALGITPEHLWSARRDLIWCSISAMGPQYPDVPGYDPAVQALCGYMDLTGMPDGPPLQCGIPLIDLKAGDEAFAQVLLALYERAMNGGGKRIDVSMAHAAVSWLQTFLPMLEMGSPPAEIRRSGNEHRQFIPVNAYPTSDGFIYVAVGSDAQWERLTRSDLFAPLRSEQYATNESRRAHKEELHRSIAAITCMHTAASLDTLLGECEIPHAPITPIAQVADLPFVASTATRTRGPDGRMIRLPPPAVSTPYLDRVGRELPLSPAYGAHTDAVLREVGFSDAELQTFHNEGLIA